MVDRPKFIAPTPTEIFPRPTLASVPAMPDPEPEAEDAIVADDETPNLYPEITHVGGVEIVDRELAVGPHPRTKKPATYKTVLRVMLADERVLLICPWTNPDGTRCDYIGETVMGVNSHRTTKHMRGEGWRRYSDEVLKAVMRAVMEAKSSGAKDYMTRAAMILNGRGLRTVSKTEWTSGSVSSLWATYHDQFPVRTPRKIAKAKAAVGSPGGRGVVKATKKGSPDSPDYLRKLATQMIEEIVVDFTRRMLGVVDVLVAGIGAVDPEMERKAEAWDQFAALQQRMLNP